MVIYDREFLETGPLHKKSLILDLEMKVTSDRKSLKTGWFNTGLAVFQNADLYLNSIH